MAKVILGSACIDERGKASGGKAGNQSGKELKTQNYYLHSKGWYRLRAIDYHTRMKIAECMRKACENKNIGYDQNQRLTLINEVKKYDYDCSKVSKAVETDCSALVRVCLGYAGVIVGNFNTANERNVIMATNKFTCTAITKESDCLEGDILVTKSKGHTVVVIQGYTKETPVSAQNELKKTVTQIAKEVIAGKWGNGTTRKSKLEKAGYNYSEIQKEVNRLLKG